MPSKPTVLPTQASCALLLSVLLSGGAQTAAASASAQAGDAAAWRCTQRDDSGRGWRCAAAARDEASSSTGAAAVPPQPTPLTPAPQASPAQGPVVVAPKTQASSPHQNPPAFTSHDLASQDWYRNNDNACSGSYQNPVLGSGDAEDSRIEISAQQASVEESVARYEGEVLVTQGTRSLQADRAEYDESTGTVTLEGNVVLRDEQGAFGGERAEVDLEDQSSSIDNANYVAHEQQLRGTADRIEVSGDGKVKVEGGSYTRCQPDSALWTIRAGTIKLDTENGQGSASNARLEVANVPVAYIPYARFPIGDQRQSGFLFPSLADTDSGFDISLPYYFNIAPNADATLAPRYSADRGYLTEAELRWLNHFDQWKISGAYLDRDDVLHEQGVEDTRRWVLAVEEAGAIGERFSTEIDITRVSDRDYLRDLNTTSLSLSRSSQLRQRGRIQYLSDHWLAQVNMLSYQSIDRALENNEQSFEQQPEVLVRYQGSERAFRLAVDGELRYTRFHHEALADGDRGFGEFNIAYPMQLGALRVKPSIGVQHLEYRLDTAIPTLGDSPARTAGQAMFDAQLPFAKLRRSDNGVSQHSLVPGLRYIYRDASEQQALPVFDSQLLTANRMFLLRDRQLGGYDRLESSNQLAVYLRHQRSDAQRGETLSATIGQVFYFQDQDTAVNAITGREATARTSALLGDVQATLGRHWHAELSALFDSNNNQLDQGNAALRYRSDDGAMASVGYQYRRSARLASLAQDIDQANLSLALPLGRKWQLVGRYQYDFEIEEASEALGGLKYNSCCVGLALVYREGLVFDDDLLQTDRDRGVYLQLELIGLVNVGSAVDNILRESILDYDRDRKTGNGGGITSF